MLNRSREGLLWMEEPMGCDERAVRELSHREK